MTVAYRTISNAYQDSVKLMRVSRDVREQRDVAETVAVMGTDENKDRLVESGLATHGDLADVGPNDLVLAARDDDQDAAADAVTEMEAELRGASAPRQGTAGAAEQPALSIASAVDRLPSASVALISVPGRYAAREAWKGLHEGLDVHVFSDNVDIAEERALKEFGRDANRLVMGPDCGTAIVDGVPLGFANDVDAGRIGVVAAAGTGLQEVTSLIDRAGEGITQAIGTGGRDLQDAVGGISTRQGLERLEADDDTDVVVLVSKPPESETMEAVLGDVEDCQTPVVVHFVGGDHDRIEAAGATPAASLAEAAEAAVRERRWLDDEGASEVDLTNGVTGFVSPEDASRLIDDRDGTDRQAIRGVYAGGTLCAEAATIVAETVPEIRSNVGVGETVTDPLDPDGHAIVDLGTDELTRGRPHPMIDPAIRTELLERTLDDDTVLLVLVDVVLGYGAVDDPAASVADAVSNADGEWPVVLASVCGTRGDPQGWEGQIQRLTDAGVAVCATNANVATLAAAIHTAARTSGGDRR